MAPFTFALRAKMSERCARPFILPPAGFKHSDLDFIGGSLSLEFQTNHGLLIASGSVQTSVFPSPVF